MTRQHTRKVATKGPLGFRRTRKVTVRAYKHKPAAYKPQVRRAGRNLRRGYRHGRRGHTWRRDAFYALGVIEGLTWALWGVTQAVLVGLLVTLTVAVALVIRARMERERAKRAPVDSRSIGRRRH